MQPFPFLEENQVALLRAEFNTGHILDENLNLRLNDNQIVYSVFESLDEAFAAADKIVRNGKVECVIYGKDQKLIKYVIPVE